MRCLVMVGVALSSASPARAGGDLVHKFLHNDYDKKHCWKSLAGSPVTTPAMVPKTPGPLVASKSPGLSLLGDGISTSADPQLAVSPHYVLVLTTGAYAFYDRSTNKQLATDGCVPINANFFDLFAPLLTEKDPATNTKNPAYINDHLDLGPNPRFDCTGSDTSGCVMPKSDPDPGWYVYDARAYYDHDTNRFWMISHARNRIFQWCDNKYICKPGLCKAHQVCNRDTVSCTNCGDDARRFVFVAVSKEEDPRKGFWEYVLVSDNSDWPLFSVRNDRLLISANNHKRVYVFNAKKLIAGTTTDPFLGQYFDDKFPESDRITLVTQYSDADGLSLILGQSGTKITVYAFKDPTKPLVKATKSLATTPSWTMQPVYRFSKFYFADDPADATGTRHHIDVHRLTASLKSSPVTVGGLSDELFTLKESGASLRMAGVLVEETGSVIAWYLAFPTDGKPPEARYNVMYANEPKFRDHAVLRASHHAETEDFISDKDIGGACEPGKVGFWITGFYADNSGATRQAVGEIEPGCGTLALCGSTCADLSSDLTSCGSCGHVCAADHLCEHGVCKPATSLPCEPCTCRDGFTTHACADSLVCDHVCRAHEPH